MLRMLARIIMDKRVIFIIGVILGIATSFIV